MSFIACMVAGHIMVCVPRLPMSSKFEEVSRKAAHTRVVNRTEYGAPLLNRKVLPVGRATASWYGPGFHGRRMANGQRFDMRDAATVAHKKLPLGTRVELTNLDNGRMLVATVRDRGPYIKGREFDLSLGAAERLGFKREGLARVAYRVLSLPNNGAS